jgi:hypothetical protein
MPAAFRNHECMPSAATTSRADAAVPSSKRSRPASVDQVIESKFRGASVARCPDERDQSGAQLPLLDDPRERALAKLVGREIESRAVVADDVHGFDGRAPPGRQRLPRANGLEESCASRTHRVDARIPLRCGGRQLRHGYGCAVDERDVEARTRECRSERQPDEPRPGDQHVEFRDAQRCIPTRTATAAALTLDGILGRPADTHVACSNTSITWFWLV